MGYVKSKTHDRPTSSGTFVVFFSAIAAISLVAAIAIFSNHARKANADEDASHASKIDDYDSDIKVQRGHNPTDSSSYTKSKSIGRKSRNEIPEVEPDIPREDEISSKTKTGSIANRRTSQFYPYLAPTSKTKRYDHSGSWNDGNFTPTRLLGVDISGEKLPNEQIMTFFEATQSGPGGVAKAARFELSNNEFGFEYVEMHRSYETETLAITLFSSDLVGKNVIPNEKALATLDKITMSLMEKYDLPEPDFDYYKNERDVEYYTYTYKLGDFNIKYGAMAHPNGNCNSLYLRVDDLKGIEARQNESRDAIVNPKTTEVRQWLAQPYKTYWPHESPHPTLQVPQRISQPSRDS